MITGYKDMKRGDTITYTRPAITKTIVVGDAFGSTGNVYPEGYGLTDIAEFNMNDDVHVELVRTPFVVGEKTFREPPVGSVVVSSDGHGYIRRNDKWVGTEGHFDWFCVSGGKLLHLGTG